MPTTAALTRQDSKVVSPPAVTISYEDQRHVVAFPEDHMMWDEIQILLHQVLANVVGLYREQMRLAALRAKGRDADPGSTWRQDAHQTEIKIALERLREVGGLSTVEQRDERSARVLSE